MVTVLAIAIALVLEAALVAAEIVGRTRSLFRAFLARRAAA
jgi:hypothetical protein